MARQGLEDRWGRVSVGQNTGDLEACKSIPRVPACGGPVWMLLVYICDRGEPAVTYKINEPVEFKK